MGGSYITNGLQQHNKLPWLGNPGQLRKGQTYTKIAQPHLLIMQDSCFSLK